MRRSGSWRRTWHVWAGRGWADWWSRHFWKADSPSLPDAIDHLVASGVNRVIVIPYFLTLGLHLQRDLPKLVDAARSAHPGLEVVVGDPLDGHPAMAEMLLDRALAGARR